MDVPSQCAGATTDREFVSKTEVGSGCGSWTACVALRSPSKMAEEMYGAPHNAAKPAETAKLTRRVRSRREMGTIVDLSRRTGCGLQSHLRTAIGTSHINQSAATRRVFGENRRSVTTPPQKAQPRRYNPNRHSTRFGTFTINGPAATTVKLCPIGNSTPFRKLDSI